VNHLVRLKIQVPSDHCWIRQIAVFNLRRQNLPSTTLEQSARNGPPQKTRAAGHSHPMRFPTVQVCLLV
jgi:hypothetical protein